MVHCQPATHYDWSSFEWCDPACWTTPAAPAAHTRYLSSPAAATLHGKTQGFVLRLPPHNTEHATFMQPFQSDLQPQLQETHRTTRTRTTTRCKTHRRNQTTTAAPAAHTRYLSSPAAATLHGKTQGFVLRLPPHNTEHATFMQSFQCDLQPQLQETHRTKPLVAKHIEGTKRPQPHPPHTRGTFHRRLQPLYTEKRKVSCSGFLPTTQSMQHSCSHSNATCNHSFKKRIELRTQEQPPVAKHREGTKRPQPHPLHTRGTCHRQLQPLYTEKHKVSCSGFLPTTQSMQHSCSHSNAICKHKFMKRIEPRTQEQPPVAKHIEGTKRPQPHPPHTRGTFHRRLQPLYTEKHKVSCSGFLPTTQSMQHSCSHSNAICNQLQETQRTTLTSTTTHCKTHRRNQTTSAAPAAHTRYLSSPAAATLHGKTQGFVLRLPPHNTEHATFMQPLQCDLQPQLQETHRTTHTGTTTRCKTHRRIQTTPAAPAAHTRYLSSPAAATLHGKTQGFVLRLPPHNTEHATFMKPFQSDLQPQLQETQRTTHTRATTRCKNT